jgi:predicted Zn-dependent peptidase
MGNNEEFRQKPPEAGPVPTVNIGDFETFQLENGLTIIVVENRKLPKVAIQMIVNHDPLVEGPLAGLSEITGELLGRGTHDHPKADIDDTIDYYGANIQTTGSGIFGSVLTKYLPQFWAVFTDILLNPSFPPEELEKIKFRHASRLQTVRNEPAEMAYHVCMAVNFGPEHPYGDILVQESLDKISLEDCQHYYQNFWRPGCSYMAVVGDISVAEVKAELVPALALWPAGEISKYQYEIPDPPSQNTFCIVDRPNAVQSEIRLTYPLDLHPASMDRLPVSVMNYIIGGGAFSGYLMSNLREDKGYTYGVRSILNFDPVCSEFDISTSVGTDVTVPAIREILFEMNRIIHEQVDEDHLTLVKNSLIGSFARSIENPQTLANRVLNMMRFNLAPDFYQTFPSRLDHVTRDEVQTMAAKYILPLNAYIVIVGDFAALKPALENEFPHAPIWTFDPFGRRLT